MNYKAGAGTFDVAISLIANQPIKKIKRRTWKRTTQTENVLLPVPALPK